MIFHPVPFIFPFCDFLQEKIPVCVFFTQETEAEGEVLPCDKESSVFIYSTPPGDQKIFASKNTGMRSTAIWLGDRLTDFQCKRCNSPETTPSSSDAVELEGRQMNQC
jgi:hypothetical protein